VTGWLNPASISEPVIALRRAESVSAFQSLRLLKELLGVLLNAGCACGVGVVAGFEGRGKASQLQTLAIVNRDAATLAALVHGEAEGF